MQLNSARQAWHDCLYTAWDSQGAFIEQLGLLGAMVQTTDKQRSASHAVHQALAGQVQAAICRLHDQVRVFGNFMYAPRCSDDDRELAEETVFNLAVSRSPRMTSAKRERCEFVAKGVMFRYRRMHQGGQSSCEDPFASPEWFKKWIDDVYGVSLPSCAWTRDWEPFVEICFQVCEDIDKKALSPIGAVLYEMKEAA
ncbi:hypothetical protein [Pseudomonas rubra]|uniref:Uncharacterized protein n=1 Tax=Pseudomonas rubra TaxID=2942627 RepID=A0ABT5PEY8_9PSED|nr:hypothetical protein [Pseudomonas rubra]MDD1016889.1 hypothetical protein [Pseudomonas rubra]MDD1039365.1 hypothetical protein [Pseudomonas rubra]MDD1157853.1 hypothetical protein [Pseudomonas rubra]